MYVRYWSMVWSTALLLVAPVRLVSPPGHLSQSVPLQRRPSTDFELLQRKLDHTRLDIETCGQLNQEATDWINAIDSSLAIYSNKLVQARWNYITNLTQYNAEQFANSKAEVDDWTIEQLPTARQYLNVVGDICNATAARMLERFVNERTVPISDNRETRKRVSHLLTSLEKIYSTATVTDVTGREYRLDPELAELFATSRDYDELKWAWEAWHNVTGPRMKSMYVELVDGMNEGARESGFQDAGVAWQVVDFEETDVELMMDKMYTQIKPLYRQLHAYVRRKLIAAYPNRGIDPGGPIPAHLLGDMWAQEWSNIIDLTVPYPNRESVNVTAALLRSNYSVLDMFQTAEEFYTSIGLEPMTDDFWSKSVLVRPRDNTPITCHASASDFHTQTDFRIKMCTQISQGDFDTVHHEMGHIEYFMQYRHQPDVFRAGANAAFHEAIGDTINLSVTTRNHLKTIGLISDRRWSASITQASQEEDINFLMKAALKKIAFLPFAYIMDKWRYRVFRGDTPPEKYNIDWWKLRRHYQGVEAPSARPIDLFDPGSKYHIPANVPYSRYFFSFIGQFQFHSSLCQLAGHTGPLHTCDIYRSTAAGNRLKSVLRLGSSRPWPEAMEIFTGQREFSVDAILEYFQPLTNWLEKENDHHSVGW